MFYLLFPLCRPSSTEGLNIHNVLFHRGFSSINQRRFQYSGDMFITAVHLKNIQHRPSLTDVCYGWIFNRPPLSTHTRTYLSLLTGLTVCPVWLIVQLLWDYAQELCLVLVSVVVRGAYADQLERERETREQGGRVSLRLMEGEATTGLLTAGEPRGRETLKRNVKEVDNQSKSTESLQVPATSIQVFSIYYNWFHCQFIQRNLSMLWLLPHKNIL